MLRHAAAGLVSCGQQQGFLCAHPAYQQQPLLVPWHLIAWSSTNKDTVATGLLAGAELLHIDEDLTPLIHVPAECNSLTVDAGFVPFLGKYIGLPAHLQRLAVSYGDLSSYGCHQDPLTLLPVLSHLTQLKSL